MEKTFDINRLFNFIRRQAVLNISSLMIAAGAIFGTLLVISLFVGYFSSQNIPALPNVYLIALYICGFVFSSKIFAELHIPQKSYAYLTLPVSVSEKLFGSWLLSSPVFAGIFYLASIIFYLLACLIGNRVTDFGEVFSLQDLKSISGYLVLQSVFFLGAVYFRNNNFMKTLFTLFLLLLFLSIYSGLLSWILWDGNRQMELNINLKGLSELSKRILSFGFWVLLGPFMLLVSYYRLKERQV